MPIIAFGMIGFALGTVFGCFISFIIYLCKTGDDTGYM